MRGLAVVAVVVGLCASAATAQEQDSQQIRRNAEQALERGDMQRDAPLAERVRQQSESLARDPSLQRERPDGLPEQRSPDRSIPIPPELFLYLLVGVLGAVLCVVAYNLYRTYSSGQRSSAHSAELPLDLAAHPIARTGDDPLPGLDEIERLARAGAYAEAIHLMLLRALEALRRRLGASWARSLTSREIARRSELGSTDRQALKVLVGAVEISRFGGQNANEQIYRACLDQYRQIGGERGTAGA